MQIKSVMYDPGYRQVPRGGVFGRILDYFWPIYESIGYCGFLIETDDGRILTSADSMYWTCRANAEYPGESDAQTVSAKSELSSGPAAE